MSIRRPEVYSYKDVDPITVYGEAVVSDGLEVRDSINGYGLVSRGLLWQFYDIWISSGVALVTTWVASASQSVTTTWTTSSSQAVTTNWTRSQGGIFGDYKNF